MNGTQTRTLLLPLLLLLPLAAAAPDPGAEEARACLPDVGCRFVARTLTQSAPDCVLSGCTPVHVEKCVPTPPRAGCLDQWWVHYQVEVAFVGWLDAPALRCWTDAPNAVVLVAGPAACVVHAWHPYDTMACPEYAVQAVASVAGHVERHVVPLGTCA